MTSDQIDRLCTDWLAENYGRGMASKYYSYSLVIPMWNDPELEQELEALRGVLCIIFGPDWSFGSTDYGEARRELRLPQETVQIPEVFIEAFAGSRESGR